MRKSHEYALPIQADCRATLGFAGAVDALAAADGGVGGSALRVADRFQPHRRPLHPAEHPFGSVRSAGAGALGRGSRMFLCVEGICGRIWPTNLEALPGPE